MLNSHRRSLMKSWMPRLFCVKCYVAGNSLDCFKYASIKRWNQLFIWEITRDLISTFCLGLDINNKSVNKLLKMSKFSIFWQGFSNLLFSKSLNKALSWDLFLIKFKISQTLTTKSTFICFRHWIIMVFVLMQLPSDLY